VALTTRQYMNAGGVFSSNWTSLLPSSYQPISGQGSIALGYAVGSGATQTFSFSQAVTDPVLMFNFVDRATYDFSSLNLASDPIKFSSGEVVGSLTNRILTITTANNLGGDGFSVRLLGNYTSASSFSISLTSGSQESVGFGIATLTSQLPSTPNPVTIRPINANNDVTSGLGTVTSRVFDGGTLILAANNADAFTITNLGGAMNVATGAVTASGVISNEGLNAGMLKKTGAGRLVLSAANTYSGGTTVEAGTLQISTMDNLGSGAVTLNGGTLAVTETIATNRAMSVGTNNGTLDVASGKALTVSGVVAGAGNLSKTSAGRLVLSGANTHSGGTTVEAGVLQVAANNNLGTGALTLNGGTLATTASFASDRALAVGASSGTLEVASGTSLTVSGVVSGAGALNKTSAGSLILSGANTHTGTLGVNQGTLVLNGSTASSVTNVSAGAALTGSGSTAGAVALSGTARPGNSPGTLSVGGDFAMAAGSVLETEIDGRTYSAAGGAGTYDRIALTGANAVFTPAGTLIPILRGISPPANDNFSPIVGDTFRVVTTANSTGVSTTGAFSAVADPTAANGMPANTRFDVIYGSNFIDLVLTPNRLEEFAKQYGIQNMVNAARAFDGIRPTQGSRGTSDNQKFFNGLYGQSADALARSILQSSGEIHAFSLSEARHGWQAATRAVSSVAGVKAERNLWIDVSGDNLRRKQDAYASAYSSNASSLWIGSHLYERKDLQLGVAGGASTRRVHSAQSGSANVDSQALALYAIGRDGIFDYSAVFSLNTSTIGTTRETSLSTGTQSNASDSTAQGQVLSLTAGMKHGLSDNINGRVWINGLVDQTRAKAFSEQGSAATALGVASESFGSAQATVGYSISGSFNVPDSSPGMWMLGAGVTHQADQGRSQVSRQMAMHGANWAVTTPNFGTVTQFVQAGVRVPLSANADAWINLDASQRQSASAKGGNVGLSIRW
jgi:autotransporter-associated beta strand protein